jgi:hypothetical protein
MSLFVNITLLLIINFFEWIANIGKVQREKNQKKTMERDFIILDMNPTGNMKDLNTHHSDECCDHGYDQGYEDGGEW